MGLAAYFVRHTDTLDESMKQTQTKPVSQLSFAPISTDTLQRACSCGRHMTAGGECEACRQKREGMLQKSAVSATLVNGVPPIVHEVLNSSGQPLDAGTRVFMEPRFGHDFSQVRVHADARAAESVRAVNALAYTVGRDVVFGEGEYAPGTSEGRRLLAHELTHVAQQRSGVSQNDVVGEPEDVWEQEADWVAGQVIESESNPLVQVFSQGVSTSEISDMQEARQMVHQAPEGVMRLKPDNKRYEVPQWAQLPPDAQKDLASREYDEAWFRTHGPEMRLTVLNLYVKLSGLQLWEFVDTQSNTKVGVIEFLCSKIDGFKDTLRKRDDFTSPEESEEEWSSREMRAVGQLHFKHFKGWPKTLVEVHIDQAGLLMRSKWWWLFPPVPLLQMLGHGLSYESYKDVYGIRNILLDQGWYSAPLIGMTPVPVKERTRSTERSGMDELFGM